MSAKQNTLIDELRKKELKGLSEAEFQGVKAEVESKGIRGLTGSAAKIVFGALQDREKAVKKHQEHDQSSHGSWASGGSGPSTGNSYANSARNKVDNAYETIRDSAEFSKIPNSEKAKTLIDETFMALQRAQSLTEPLPKLREAQSASALLQELKTDFLDKMDASSKSKFAGFTSEIKSAIRDTEKLQEKIFSNFDDEGNTIKKATSVSQGDMVSWNSAGGSATGKVIRVVREGVLAVPETSFQLKGDAENPAVLIQLYRDGKPTDKKVGHKMSTLSKSVDVEKASSQGVKNKAEEHNAEVGDVAGKRTTAAILQQVYNRGVGAYKTNPSSVRPNVTSEQQWAMGRVNGFLHALRTGRYKRSPYDTDLLPEQHSLSSKGKEKEEKKDK